MPLRQIEELPEFEPRDRGGIWIYKLDRDYTRSATFSGAEFCAKWLTIAADGTLTIPAGYAWDGCTPKFSLLDLLVLGVPDGVVSVHTGKPKTYYASLVHDALYQYFAWHSISRLEADQLFRDMMSERGFSLSWVYYWLVRVFGGLFVPKKHPNRTELVFTDSGGQT